MLTSYTLIAKGYEKYVLRSNIYAIIISLIFNVVLITKFNILGAAMATLIAMTIRCLSNMVYLKRSGVFYSNILKIILFLTVSVLNLLTLRFYYDSILINLSSTIFILAILVMCFSIITKDDIIYLKENLISKI
jgi:O-antigen/teichoic acid export membrane protein